MIKILGGKKRKKFQNRTLAASADAFDNELRGIFKPIDRPSNVILFMLVMLFIFYGTLNHSERWSKIVTPSFDDDLSGIWNKILL